MTTKNLILSWVACVSAGILMGGMIGLPLGMGIGFKSPRKTPSIEVSPSPGQGNSTAAPEAPIPFAPARQTFAREYFNSLVSGKTKKEIEIAVGKPDRKTTRRNSPFFDGSEPSSPEDYWFYHNKTVDTYSGKVDNVAKITFSMGYPIRVEFE